MRILAILLLFSLAAWAKDDVLTVHCNGNPVNLQAVLRNGVAYYPIEDLVSVTGARVNWNPSAKELRINETVIDVEPVYLGGKIYLPLDTFANAAGYTTTWDAGRGTVVMKRVSTNMPQAAHSVSTPGRARVPGGHDLPYDATLDGRLPAGWQFANPIEPPAAPLSRPTPPTQASINVMKRAENNSGDVFIPRSARNAAFHVTVTNLERLPSFRGYYQAKSGYLFYVVYLSQKNISGVPQVYPGKFHLQDAQGNSYDSMEELSSFWPVIMKPFGINFGYLVYEIPDTTFPARLVHTTVGLAPLSVNF